MFLIYLLLSLSLFKPNFIKSKVIFICNNKFQPPLLENIKFSIEIHGASRIAIL
jgi:hypothetical protein